MHRYGTYISHSGMLQPTDPDADPGICTLPLINRSGCGSGSEFVGGSVPKSSVTLRMQKIQIFLCFNKWNLKASNWKNMFDD
jgi:hypothetical protein